MQTKIAVTASGIEVTGPYSDSNNTRWRQLNGRYTGGRWVIPDTEPARAAIAELFGAKSDEVTVEVTRAQLDRSYGSPIQIGGYVIATRRERDYAAQCADGVVVAKGVLPSSGGSRKSPGVNPPDDCVFHVQVRKAFAEARGLQVVTAMPEAPKLEI